MRITKRQLLQIIKEEKARLREQEEVSGETDSSGGVTIGVEDVAQSADNFGGGEVEEEIFVDAVEDEVLNQLDDQVGEAPEGTVTERARLKSRLRKLVREGTGSALPPVDDLAKKLSSAGAEEAMSYLKRLLDKVSFGAAPSAEVEAPALPPELPPADMAPPEDV